MKSSRIKVGKERACRATHSASLGLPDLRRLLASLILLLASSLLAAASTADEPAGVSENPNLTAAQYVLMEFRDGRFRIVEVTSLDLVLPPSQPLPAELGKLSGFWFELQSEEGRVRYRRIVNHPLVVADGIEGEEVARRGTFSMVIPRPRPGEELVLFSSPLEPGELQRPARELLRLPASILF
jgi:hypothetical protein